MNPTRRTRLIQVLANIDQLLAEAREVLRECPEDCDTYFQATQQLGELEDTRCQVERMLEATYGRSKN